MKLDTNENPKIKPGQQQKLELNVNSSQSEVVTEKSENMISEKKDNDNRKYNEKDDGASSPNTIPSKNSEITQKDETTDAKEAKKDIDFSFIDSSFDINHGNIEKDILSAAMETQKLDKALSGPSTSVQLERDEMECKTSGVSNESNSVSFESENEATSSIDSDQKLTSEEHNQPTPPPIVDDSTAMTPDDDDQPTSSVSLGDSKKKTKDIDESSDNQLVPEGIESDKPGDDKEDTAGEDQVVDENNNKTYKTSEEDDEENMIAKQICDGVLTDSMLDQEKKLHQEHLEEEKEMVTKVCLGSI